MLKKSVKSLFLILSNFDFNIFFQVRVGYLWTCVYSSCTPNWIRIQFPHVEDVRRKYLHNV